MAAKQTKFTDLRIGQTFYADGGNGYEQYKKISSLEYESIQNSVLGSFYSTPGLLVDLINKTDKPAPVAKKPAKKAAKKAAKK
jgi:hypothetical protein